MPLAVRRIADRFGVPIATAIVIAEHVGFGVEVAI